MSPPLYPTELWARDSSDAAAKPYPIPFRRFGQQSATVDCGMLKADCGLEHILPFVHSALRTQIWKVTGSPGVDSLQIRALDSTRSWSDLLCR